MQDTHDTAKDSVTAFAESRDDCGLSAAQ